ncbi:unnamed protein product [Ambrosiozyma monospora]|uniref:Unnamed protein product n=1 Tax=Ambrosiozyma monospora TaxID=43982 RepID=A0A9W7DCP8_AMBMO|nr:unnamed protein product [Ambrosiozyma monospora]
MSKKQQQSNGFQFPELYVRTLKEDLLNSLQLMYFDSLTFEEKTKEDYTNSKPLTLENLQLHSQVSPVVPKPRVSKSVKNEDAEKLNDFERYNRKRVSTGSSPLTEEEFEKVMDTLSLSGSDSSSDEEDDVDFYKRESKLDSVMETSESSIQSSVSFLNTRSPFVLFKSPLLPPGKCFAVYKTTLEATLPNAEPLSYLKNLNSSSEKSKLKTETSALFMIGGGHFAGAIISHQPLKTKGNQGTPQELQLQSVQLLEHKTFHRYTTRRKQGGSQSAMDNAKGKANSAGSNLRRYNEQALQQDVRELLALWKPQLDHCQNIFIKASGAAGHKTLVGYPGASIASGDKRVKIFPFTTKRPTSNEIKRAWVELNYLKIQDIPNSSRSAFDKQERQKELLEKSKKQPKKSTPQAVHSDPDVKLSGDLVALLKKSKAPALISFLKKNKVDVNFTLTPKPDYHNTPTMLHYASNHGLNHMVQILLNNLKADPTIQNEHGKVAAQIAHDVQTKYTFEVVRGQLGEEYCDWVNAAKVENVKTREEVEQINKAAFERESEQKKQSHAQELENFKKEQEQRRVDQFGQGRKLTSSTPIVAPKKTEEQNLNSLTAQQRMRVMREQRARAAEARMKKTNDGQ